MLNVVSIVVGLLIARVIIAWIYAIQVYIHSKIYIDMDEQELDCDIYKQKALSALLVTLFSVFIIIVIFKIVNSSLSNKNE